MLENGFHQIPLGKVAMIVTHLEMRAPKLRGVPLPEGLSFAPLTVDVEAYRALFRHIGTQWLWFGRLRMEDAALEAILSNPDVHMFSLFKNGAPEAILELDFRKKGVCELAFFGLSATLIGSGAGAYLMDRAIENAFRAPIKQLHLHTCTLDSPQALGFYQRSGFKPVRQEVEIDDDPRLLGVHPQDAGPHVPIFQP